MQGRSPASAESGGMQRIVAQRDAAERRLAGCPGHLGGATVQVEIWHGHLEIIVEPFGRRWRGAGGQRLSEQGAFIG